MKRYFDIRFKHYKSCGYECDYLHAAGVDLPKEDIERLFTGEKYLQRAHAIYRFKRESPDLGSTEIIERSKERYCRVNRYFLIDRF